MSDLDQRQGFGYNAFISYSRRDKAFAQALEKALEKYHPPKGLNVPQRHLNVFRDEGDLVGSEYYESIERHLQESEKLIVLCTPSARQSDYVNDEIRRFAGLRDQRNIIPLLLEGVPNNVAVAGGEGEMAFPDALCEVLEMPLAIDFTGCAPVRSKITGHLFGASWYSLLAGIFDRERAQVEQRERRRQRNRRITVFSVTLALAAQVAGRNLSADEWLRFYADSEYRLNPRRTFESFQLEPENGLTGIQ